MADKSKVKMSALTRLTALVILELFLFSDFSMPLSQINSAYALVPSLVTNGKLDEKTHRGGAITVDGHELTKEEHIAVNQAIMQDFAEGKVQEITEDDLKELDPDGIAKANNIRVVMSPRLDDNTDLIAHPSRGGEQEKDYFTGVELNHNLKQVILSPKRATFIKGLSPEAKKQFWEHEVLGHLVEFGRGASEEDIQAKYPINLVRNAAQIAALQQQTAPQRAQLRQLLIYVAENHPAEFKLILEAWQAKRQVRLRDGEPLGYDDILLRYAQEALGQKWLPGPSTRDRQEVFEEVNQLVGQPALKVEYGRFARETNSRMMADDGIRQRIAQVIFDKGFTAEVFSRYMVARQNAYALASDDPISQFTDLFHKILEEIGIVRTYIPPLQIIAMEEAILEKLKTLEAEAAKRVAPVAASTDVVAQNVAFFQRTDLFEGANWLTVSPDVIERDREPMARVELVLDETGKIISRSFEASGPIVISIEGLVNGELRLAEVISGNDRKDVIGAFQRSIAQYNIAIISAKAEAKGPVKTETLDIRKNKLEVTFIGELWIIAGSYTYKVWVEGNTVNFQRYGSKEGQAQGKLRQFNLDEVFQVGRERGVGNTYLIPSDIELSGRHFKIKVSNTTRGNIYKLTIENLNSGYSTTVEWSEPVVLAAEAVPEDKLTSEDEQRIITKNLDILKRRDDLFKQARLLTLFTGIESIDNDDERASLSINVALDEKGNIVDHGDSADGLVVLELEELANGKLRASQIISGHDKKIALLTFEKSIEAYNAKIQQTLAAQAVHGKVASAPSVGLITIPIEEMWETEEGLHTIMSALLTNNENETHFDTMEALADGKKVTIGGIIRAVGYFVQFKKGKVENTSDIEELFKVAEKLRLQIGYLVVRQNDNYTYGKTKGQWVSLYNLLDNVLAVYKEHKGKFNERVQKGAIPITLVSIKPIAPPSSTAASARLPIGDSGGMIARHIRDAEDTLEREDYNKALNEAKHAVYLITRIRTELIESGVDPDNITDEDSDKVGEVLELYDEPDKGINTDSTEFSVAILQAAQAIVNQAQAALAKNTVATRGAVTPQGILDESAISRYQRDAEVFADGVIRRLQTQLGLSGADFEAYISKHLRPHQDSVSGFIGSNEDLRQLLIDDYITVYAAGYTHQGLAGWLEQLSKAEGESTITINGQMLRLRRVAYRGAKAKQPDIFSPPTAVMPQRPVTRGMQMSPLGDKTATNVDYTVENLTTGKRIHFSGLMIGYIKNYGFYEGHDDSGNDLGYRLNPADIIEVFTGKRPDMVPVRSVGKISPRPTTASAAPSKLTIPPTAAPLAPAAISAAPKPTPAPTTLVAAPSVMSAATPTGEVGVITTYEQAQKAAHILNYFTYSLEKISYANAEILKRNLKVNTPRDGGTVEVYYGNIEMLYKSPPYDEKKFRVKYNENYGVFLIDENTVVIQTPDGRFKITQTQTGGRGIPEFTLERIAAPMASAATQTQAANRADWAEQVYTRVAADSEVEGYLTETRGTALTEMTVELSVRTLEITPDLMHTAEAVTEAGKKLGLGIYVEKVKEGHPAENLKQALGLPRDMDISVVEGVSSIKTIGDINTVLAKVRKGTRVIITDALTDEEATDLEGKLNAEELKAKNVFIVIRRGWSGEQPLFLSWVLSKGLLKTNESNIIRLTPPVDAIVPGISGSSEFTTYREQVKQI